MSRSDDDIAMDNDEYEELFPVIDGSRSDDQCPDCGRASYTGEDCYWPDEAGIARPEASIADPEDDGPHCPSCGSAEPALRVIRMCADPFHEGEG